MCVKFHGLHVEMAAPPCLSCPGTITAAAVPEAEYCKFIIQTPIKDCGLRWGRAGQDRYENPIKAALNAATDDDGDGDWLSLAFSYNMCAGKTASSPHFSLN